MTSQTNASEESAMIIMMMLDPRNYGESGLKGVLSYTQDSCWPRPGKDMGLLVAL